ncbi:MAG: deoxyribonuclease IV [Candidatus Omnitrophica bacterium]|nr:deoxyribonuclease IV [Candidatus Omnitrophota bacterium]
MEIFITMRFGVHVSVAGGLHMGLRRAVQLGCDTAQLFLVNPRAWQSPPLTDKAIELFQNTRQTEAKWISPLIAHMPYLPNLAAADDDIFEKSIAALRDNLKRCDALGIDFLVTHMGRGEGHGGTARMREGIARAYGDDHFNVCLLLENTAGQGREMGSQVTDLCEFYGMLPEGISKGICIDTCHAFAAGYDISQKESLRKLIQEFQQYIGFFEVKVIHVNDSLKPLGSRVDRHAKIGQGMIGTEGFHEFFANTKIRKLPCILEVPRKSDEEDIEQLQLVRSLAARGPK